MLTYSSLKLLFTIGILSSVFVIQVICEDKCTIRTLDQVSTVLETCKDVVIDNLKVPGGKQLTLNINPGTILTFRGNTSFGYYEWSGPFIRLEGSNFAVKGETGRNIIVRRVFCHGSHGLTISGNAEILNDVLIEDSIVTMAENGIHIKTRVDADEGLINNVTYRNITLLDSKFYGINIQQNYVPLPAGEPQIEAPQNNTPIRNLQLINIYGNVLNGAVPVYVLCAEEGCFDWKWEGVKILGAEKDNCTNYVPDGYTC